MATPLPPSEFITLRELLDYREEFRVHIAECRERWRGVDIALDKQNGENERHFERINDTYAKAQKILTDDRTYFLERRVHEEFEKQIDQKFATLQKEMDECNHQLTAAAGRDAGIQLSWGVLLSAITAVSIFAGLIAKFVLH
jgi:hypothetical protein